MREFPLRCSRSNVSWIAPEFGQFRFVFSKSFVFALFLCLCASVPAQEPEMIAPPLPAFYTTPPPDPETLPPPPPLAWEALPPRDSGGETGTTGTGSVPPPQDETPLAPPPPPVVETPLPGTPDPADEELARPEVEVWRPEGELPQIPERHLNRLDQAYVTGTEPAVLRVQFNPLAAGKRVHVKPGKGITLIPPVTILTVAGNGECIVSAQIAAGFSRGHIIFYCEGAKTVLPVWRAPLATVVEAESGGEP